VQIPCIERNAIGAVKLSTPRMALDGDGRYRVPLDSVIRTLAQTGVDMKSKYKERAHARTRGERRTSLTRVRLRETSNHPTRIEPRCAADESALSSETW
jgi:hypothetical protein